MYGATIFKTDGSTEEIRAVKTFYTLDWMQDQVGGRIQVLRYSDNQVLVVNEEGLMQDLPLNAHVANGRFCGDIICMDSGILHDRDD
jgi:hypothetical protein